MERLATLPPLKQNGRHHWRLQPASRMEHGLCCGAKYCEVIYLEVLGAGGRGAEATVLLGGRIRLDKIFTRNNILSNH